MSHELSATMSSVAPRPLFAGPTPSAVVIQFTPRQEQRFDLGVCQSVSGDPLQKGRWVNWGVDPAALSVKELAAAGFGYVQFAIEGHTISAHLIRQQTALYYPIGQAATALQMLMSEAGERAVLLPA